MKCTGKTYIGLLLSACILSCQGCGSDSGEMAFSNPYDIYTVSEKYQMIEGADISYHNTEPFFASDYCISDGTDLGTDQTSSYVSKAAGVFHLNTKEIPYAQNIYGRIYPASTTKILTAYIALKYGNPDDIYTVSEKAVDQKADASVCDLKAGDKLTLRQLLYGLMMKSGNDAAVAIAEGLSESTEEFAKRMNQEARALGAVDSHFVNPNGLHDTEHYTTVYDLYLLFQAAIQEEGFLDLIQQKEYTVDYRNAAGEPMRQIWKTTNKYLAETETPPKGITVVGGKTGTTNDAGYCLVLLSKNAADEPVISIVMKADSRDNLYYHMNELLRGFSDSR